MIPILYSGMETDFTSNGLGRLVECTSCLATEEQNGIYEIAFRYPITGRFYQEMITNGGTVSVIHDDRHDRQAFDIYKYSAPIDGIVTFYARHISYRLSKCIVKPFSASSCAAALAAIPTNAYTPTPFTFWTDKAVSSPFSTSRPWSARALLGGVEGSILDVYGKGEYQFDMFTVRLYVNRGVDSGVTIRYGKNLTDMTHMVDRGEIYSAIAPFWIGAEGEAVFLPEGFVTGSVVPVKQYPWTDEHGNVMEDGRGNEIYFQIQDVVPVPMDFSADFQEAPTVEQLRAAAVAFLDNNTPWLPDENLTIDFVQLWQTPEYADVAALQRVSLGDTVSVYFPQAGVVMVKQKVIKVVYDVLLERYDSMELGQLRTTLAETITQQVDSKLNSMASLAVLRSAVEYATQQITGGLGGYVVMTLNADGLPQEFLILDTPDIETAVNVWRWNRGALGHSHSGYAGPYDDIALTQDGRINASMITVGTLTAALIKAGVLADLAGHTSWNMETGVLTSDRLEINTPNFTLSADGTISAKNVSLQGALTNYVGTTIVNRLNNAGLYIRSDPSAANPYFYKIMPYDYDGFVLTYGNEAGQGKAAKLDNHALGFKSDSSPMNQTDTWNYPNSAQYAAAGVSIYGNEEELPGSGIYKATVLTYSNFSLRGSFSATGTKSRAVKTKEYGERLLYCYETPSPTFGDIGEGEIGEDGLCYVWLDPVFARTISESRYQVFLQPYGAGECYIQERKNGLFVVQGTPGLAFGWELKARQADYDQLRLERSTPGIEPEAVNYADEAANYIQNLMSGRIST